MLDRWRERTYLTLEYEQWQRNELQIPVYWFTIQCETWETDKQCTGCQKVVYLN